MSDSAQNEPEKSEKEIIYIGDPMCSWCYGFSPTIQKLHDKHRGDVAWTMVLGGLRVGDEHVVDQARLDFLREHWVEIGERTGQKFSLDILKETGWIYNTEWACRAVVVMRKLKPEIVFAYFGKVQENFYAKNLDPSEPEHYADTAAEFGVDSREFLKLYKSDEIIQETLNDFVWAQRVGVTGFPTVLVREGDKIGALTLGYQPLEALEGPLESWIKQGFPEQAEPPVH